MKDLSNQLALFKDQTKDIDRFVFEFECAMNGYKAVATLLEDGTIPFNLALRTSNLYNELCEMLYKDGVKYKDRPKTYWKQRMAFSPYYRPVEPRSGLTLPEVARRQQVSSYAILERFKTILGVVYPLASTICTEIIENDKVIVKYLYDKSL